MTALQVQQESSPLIGARGSKEGKDDEKVCQVFGLDIRRTISTRKECRDKSFWISIYFGMSCLHLGGA
jgi:hypothetical protein